MTVRNLAALLALVLAVFRVSAQDEPTPPAGGAPAESSEPATVPAVPSAPGREVSFPATEVKDTFFAYVLGVIASGQPVDMDSAAMRAVLVEFKSALNLPFDSISRVIQGPDPDTGGQNLALTFQRDVSIPVPFAILWYHPGSIVASRELAFDVRRVPWTDPVAGGEPGTAFDCVLVRGTCIVNIDDWLEALFSSHLEDTGIQHIVFFKWNGDWIGMIEGLGRRTERTRRAFFDFTRNEIRFPAPDSLSEAGRQFVP